MYTWLPNYTNVDIFALRFTRRYKSHQKVCFFFCLISSWQPFALISLSRMLYFASSDFLFAIENYHITAYFRDFFFTSNRAKWRCLESTRRLKRAVVSIARRRFLENIALMIAWFVRVHQLIYVVAWKSNSFRWFCWSISVVHMNFIKFLLYGTWKSINNEQSFKVKSEQKNDKNKIKSLKTFVKGKRYRSCIIYVSWKSFACVGVEPFSAYNLHHQLALHSEKKKNVKEREVSQWVGFSSPLDDLLVSGGTANHSINFLWIAKPLVRFFI